MSDNKQVTGSQVTVSLDGKNFQYPLIEGSEKERALDIAKLRADSGLITLDYGFMNTGATQSAITFLDGERGILRYRGIPIEQLAEKSNFLEVAYLLINGKLPNASESKEWTTKITNHTLIHEDLNMLYDALPRTAHPMAVLTASVVAMGTYYPDFADPDNKQQVNDAIVRLIAKLAALWYRKANGRSVVYPKNNLNYCANFINMMFSLPSVEYKVDPEVADALDKILILHADHEQNCSTSTVRMVGSSKADVFASIAAGITALSGPLHGGANQEVLEMLQLIVNDGGNVAKYVDLAKKKESNFRLMGFGHRVYKNFDPRAKIIKKSCDTVLAKLGIKDPLLDVAKQLEEAALKDSYFIEKKLYPNVDFYSGIIYRALGIPTNMFTVMFAMGRLPGWLAHWKEMNESKATKIGRPRQIYTGPTETNYLPLEKR